ncbi:MAG: glycosyltransferase [Chloroflexi bacterium]|nr:glycosyltransferase [Chloroflexota bacterium]
MIASNWPKISVVVPSYKQGRFLSDAIESVLLQDYANLELIVIDGGSSDESVHILRKYEKHFAYWVSEPDEGQADALVKGFALATGQYLTWLNSDDVLLAGALTAVAQFISKTPEAQWISSQKQIRLDAKGLVRRVSRLPLFSPQLARLGALVVGGSSTFFSSQLYRKCKGINPQLYYTMDADLWWQIFSSGATCYLLKEPLFGHRQHEASKTSGFKFIENFKKAEQLRGLYKIESRQTLSRYKNKRVAYFARIAHRFRQVANGNYVRAYLDSRRLFGVHWRQI